MKEEKSQRMLIGIGVVVIAVVIGFVIYLFRSSDPAASGPIPYKKFDYGTHMQQQTRDLNRQPGAAGAASPQAGSGNH